MCVYSAYNATTLLFLTSTHLTHGHVSAYMAILSCFELSKLLHCI
jgi:hypothetical protein